LVLAASGTPADAGGSLKDNPAAETYAWSGLSVGAGIGIGSFDHDIWADASRKDFVKKKHCWWWWCFKDFDYKEVEQHGHFSQDSWKAFGTLQIGYDRLIGDRLLLGAFADFDFYWDANDEFFKETVKYYKTVGTLSGDLERDHIWTVGGRVGLLLKPRILGYVLAGYSQMKLDGSLNAHFNDPLLYGQLAVPTDLTLNLPSELHGYTLGAGVELKREKRLSLKLEYRYSHFDGAEASASASSFHEFEKHGWGHKTEIKHWIKENANVKLDDMDVHSVRAVLVWKLTDDAHHVEPLK
jgi:outer membrane immunogenic protein